MKCTYCDREMTKTQGCTAETVTFRDGVKLPAIVHDMDNRCHDCGAHTGHYHHPGCDMERCPRCKGQLISCWCGHDEDDDSLDTAPETREDTMPISLKKKAIEQLNTGWHTAAMLGHCIGCARKTAEGIIRAIKKERSDVRKLSVSGKGYYCLAQPATPQEDTP